MKSKQSKRALSLAMAMTMASSLAVPALAGDTQYYTKVVYNADEASGNSEQYELTVPATMYPGSSDNVTLSGTWASTKKISVSADKTVTMTSDGEETEVIDVDFAGIDLVGKGKTTVEKTAQISLSEMNALSGNFEGGFYYHISVSSISGSDTGENAGGGDDSGGSDIDNGSTDNSQTPQSNPSNGLKISVSEANANGFTFTSYEDGLQVTSFENVNFSSTINVPEQIGDFKVLSLADGVFDGQTNLKTITLPDTVSNLGKGVFNGCTNLSSVTLSNSLTEIADNTFAGCSALTSFTITENIASIGTKAFYECSGLTTVTIPNSVTSIGDYSFCQCEAVSIDFKGTKSEWNDLVYGVFWNDYMGDYTISCTDGSIDGGDWSNATAFTGDTYSMMLSVFGEGFITEDLSIPKYFISNFEDSDEGVVKGQKCIVTSVSGFRGKLYSLDFNVNLTIPNSVTIIEDEAFFSCEKLVSVNIPNSVTCIGEDAFRGCSSLSEVEIPNGVLSLGKYSFSGSGIKSITLPDSLTSIGESAFYHAGLISVSIPKNITSIEKEVFKNCTALTSIELPDGLLSIGYHSFDGCSALKSVTIPDSVTSIGSSAFTNCSGLTSVKLSQNLTAIPEGLFSYCRALKEINIPAGVTAINGSAFSVNTSLETVTMPTSVKTIAAMAFYYCKNLTNVYYTGSRSNWSNISIGSDNEYLTGASNFVYNYVAN